MVSLPSFSPSFLPPSHSVEVMRRSVPGKIRRKDKERGLLLFPPLFPLPFSLFLSFGW